MECQNNVMSRTSVDDPDRQFINNIYSALWENPGYLPDPVREAFRDAMIKCAIEICHECGTEKASAQFCVETITNWMKHDTPVCNQIEQKSKQ